MKIETPTLQDLEKWQTEKEMIFASYSGFGESGSLSCNGRGMFIVRKNRRVVLRTIDSTAALERYLKRGARK